MTKDNLKLTTLAVLIASVPALAVAGLSVGDQTGVSADEIRAALGAQGAEVLEIEIEDGAIEVEYLLDGVEYEAEINPANGTVLALEQEDEDDDEEDDNEDDEDDNEEDND